MTLEEALPLVRSLSPNDKLRLIDELAKELLAERRAGELLAGVAPPDDADEPRWTEWLGTVLDGAAERIGAARRAMRSSGILDDEGRLTPGPLPADMRSGSESSVSTG